MLYLVVLHISAKKSESAVSSGRSKQETTIDKLHNTNRNSKDITFRLNKYPQDAVSKWESGGGQKEKADCVYIYIYIYIYIYRELCWDESA